MAPIAIRAANLTKHYTVPGRRPGLFQAKTPPTVFRAVEDVSFAIQPGERVAFIGPNGAGKSTTIKMLSGILTPTAGVIEVLGLVPTADRIRLTYKIAAVFGQRSQLWLHLAVRESWEVLGHIYGTKITEQRARIKDLAKRFNAEDLVDKPVKQLSLGERMRCELIACLLHRPQVLFLDEPTIGLDVEAKTMMRDLIKDMSVSEGTTVLLTSHDTGDMESVCERVLMINRGKLVLDESVALLRRRFVTDKVIVVTTTDRDVDWRGIDCQILEQKPHTTRLTIDATRGNISTVMQRILAHTSVQDIAVEDPPLESTIKRIYATTGQTLAH